MCLIEIRHGTNTILDQDTRLDQTEFDLAEVTNDQLLRRYTTELHLMLQHLIFGTYYSTTKNDTKMKLVPLLSVLARIVWTELICVSYSWKPDFTGSIVNADIRNRAKSKEDRSY